MQKTMKTPAIIYDIDGTLSDPTHRLHFIQEEPRDWKSFYEQAPKDPAYRSMIQFLLKRAMEGYKPLYLTSRPESMRDMTTEWLFRFGCPISPIFMRPEGDYRPSEQIKKEQLTQVLNSPANYEIYEAYDDNSANLNLFVEARIPRVLHPYSVLFEHSPVTHHLV